jgi:membrane-associated phospholipid phosphatase
VKFLLVLALVCLPAPVFAQEPTPFKWETHAEIPQRISDVAVAANLAFDAWHAFYHTDTRAKVGFACRNGLTFVAAEAVKRMVHRERPNGFDQKSFYSEHNAFAWGAVGDQQRALSASLALVVAWGRQAGGMHYGSDVTVGASAGFLSRWICPN